jgi:hypothetical protein
MLEKTIPLSRFLNGEVRRPAWLWLPTSRKVALHYMVLYHERKQMKRGK